MKYIVLTQCMGHDEVAYKTEKDGMDQYPVIYNSEEEAWKEIADDMVTILQQFIDGDREFEHTDFDCQDYPVECQIHLFDKKEYFWIDEIGKYYSPRTGDYLNSLS